MAINTKQLDSKVGYKISGVNSKAKTGEAVLRRAAAWLLMYFQFQGSLGLAMDIGWHRTVGRDTFFTPPHILLYTGVGFGGLLCLFMVLLETFRYKKGAGPDDSNTIRLFGIFHAPLGFIVAGFGVLGTVSAAPLDNYWHELYGIDVVLWAPFHMMGIFGAFVTMLGSVYIWSTFVREEQLKKGNPTLFSWSIAGLVLSSLNLISQAATLATPSLRQFPTIELGPLSLLSFPLIIAALVPWVLLNARLVIGKRGAASLVALAVTLQAFLFGLLIPALIQYIVTSEGLTYRNQAPHFEFSPVILNLIFLSAALLIDFLPSRLTAGISKPWSKSGILTGLVIWLLSSLYLQMVVQNLDRNSLPPEIRSQLPAPATLAAYLIALPVTLLIVLVSLNVGKASAEVLRRNPR